MNIRLSKGNPIARSRMTPGLGGRDNAQEMLLWLGVVFLAVMALVMVFQVRGVFTRKDLTPGAPAVPLLQAVKSLTQTDGLTFFVPKIPSSLRPTKSADDDDAMDLPDIEEPADGARVQTFSRCRLPKEQADMTDDDEDPATQQLLGGQYDSDSEWDVEAVPASPVEAEPTCCNATEAEAEAQMLMDAEIEMSTDMEFTEAESFHLTLQ